MEDRYVPKKKKSADDLVIVAFKVTRAERALMQESAARDGRTLSGWVRKMLAVACAGSR